MLIRLVPGSPHPAYHQIAMFFAGQIEDGALVSGDRLPSARALGEAIGVNMHTVLKAYDELQTMGLVEKRRGRGGVVVAPEAGIAQLARSLARAARRQGMSRRELVAKVEEAW